MSFNLDSITHTQLKDEEIVNLATFAENAENYEHAYALISLILERKLRNKDTLSLIERNLYGNAVTKIISHKHQALQKTMSAALTHGNLKLFQGSGYELMLRLDTETCCNQMIDKLKPFITGQNIENDVYLLKIMGELYHSAWRASLTKHEYKDLAKEQFLKAHELAHHLDILNPVRLGLILNYAAFMYEWEETRDQAVVMASKTYEEASTNASGMKDEWKTKTQGLLESIKTNITSWTNTVNAKIKNASANINNSNNNNNNNDDEKKATENTNGVLISNAQIDPVTTTTSTDILLDNNNNNNNISNNIHIDSTVPVDSINISLEKNNEPKQDANAQITDIKP